MNKEFKLLTDGSVEVMDENGHITKRPYDNHIQETLLVENKRELIDNELQKWNKNLHDQEGVVSLSNGMLKFQPILILFATLGGVAYGGLFSSGDSLIYAIYHGVAGLFFSSIFASIEAIFWGIIKPIYKKKIKKTNLLLEKAKQLNEDYERELLEIKERQTTTESLTISMNESISLVEETDTIKNQIDEELNRVYANGMSGRSKKLVLRRKKSI